MILVDTSIWIEFLKLNRNVFDLFNHEMEQQNIVVTECVFGELLQGAKNKRERKIILEYWNNLPKKDEKNLWLDAGNLSGQKKYFAKGIGLIDTFLIAFARRHKVQIWTLDKKLMSVLSVSETYQTNLL
ncbi:MAG TPA: VapC toxin family PIN domain ribonuclease [Deltaproteobacteria bacterium]|nr:MAG: hypothetical protein A2048_07120 [Deltaproteobacteria bacterium GWA2_45_12]HBF13853.1 VapC toxin family PIN domain ribonuclease [Deltaproteobacteria bacterium]